MPGLLQASTRASNQGSWPTARAATPLVITAWEQALAQHPDRAFVRYISEELRKGFRIGFQAGSPLQSATTNMRSALEHPEVIDTYLKGELSRGRMLGPFADADQLPNLHINRFGVIPKGHNSGEWRLITDLSYPQGASVNDAIDPELCSHSQLCTWKDLESLVGLLNHACKVVRSECWTCSICGPGPASIHLTSGFRADLE